MCHPRSEIVLGAYKKCDCVHLKNCHGILFHQAVTLCMCPPAKRCDGFCLQSGTNINEFVTLSISYTVNDNPTRGL